MISLTTNIVKHLDLMRKIGVGASAVCIPLIHSTGQGYEPLSIGLPGGWTLEDSDEGTEPRVIVAEQDWVDEGLLTQANAFSIDGRVFKIVGMASAPSPGAILREWKFVVHVTTEEFEA